MKRLINVIHFVFMTGIYVSALVIYLIFCIKLFLVLFGIANPFGLEEWLTLLLIQSVVINCFFTIRHRGVMDLFGFPFDEKELLP